ncbi:MAG: hypothetical protein A4E52_01904 [Pelotomaculum sp. PtaB.Bin013]|uniref:Uncharacterized protein n=1 Tax=Pelotomaculum isophthalicicum JI TaxID=947010 RepID=A0A9X4GZB4_9FIRM|nr:hypothetical protein [Pelotomaculum isophthalicicum]MDF9408570.1 hypothetical protein [Pelotomaculum isophthalicicum JI]OPX83158.1 MAG: hypothetical protein A4E52_01904 [Pelotomaculum sp. PtaB.Bin013]
MYPQTHVYFAETVLGKQGDIVTLGSILPDMLIGKDFNHNEAHSKGVEIYNFAGKDSLILDFGKAVSTHGFNPKGLDYYGDEKYLDYERGYCFEKARPFIARTVEACNIPVEMGWWKAHNIIEMGVETIISSTDYYSERIKTALYNRCLINKVDEILRELWKKSSLNFARRVERFAGFVEIERATAESLAKKYYIQMQFRHHVEIDVKMVTKLINDAAESVILDLNDFFNITSGLVKNNIEALLNE